MRRKKSEKHHIGGHLSIFWISFPDRKSWRGSRKIICIFGLPERFGLFNLKPGHQPVKLLPCEGSDFLWITRPAKTALCLHPFVKE